MNLEEFLGIASLGVETAMIVSAPVLIFGLVAGVAVSVLQAATQINDAALAFIPKIVATVIALALFGSWMISKMAMFASFALNHIPQVTS